MTEYEQEVRKLTTCPSCGGPKTVGTTVCWAKCWSGPNGLKDSGMEFDEWMLRKFAKLHLREYGPGKYSHEVDAYVDQGEADQTIGSVTEEGRCYQLIRAPLLVENDTSDLTEDEQQFLKMQLGGAILTEDDQGFVDVQYFASPKEMATKWAEIELSTMESETDEHGD